MWLFSQFPQHYDTPASCWQLEYDCILYIWLVFPPPEAFYLTVSGAKVFLCMCVPLCHCNTYCVSQIRKKGVIH